MILPITAYGHPTLKMMGEEITKDYPDLDKLIEDMFETMYAAEGVGLPLNKSTGPSGCLSSTPLL